MKAIILSGGAGTRLSEISGGVPKPMMPLLGKPLLERTVALLRENGFSRLCVTLCYAPKTIRDFLGDGSRFGVSVEYRTEKSPLGTAGAVRNCRNFIGSEPVLIISGDSACDFDLGALYRSHTGGVTIALTAHKEPLRYGLVLTDRAGRVTGFVEKPAWERVVTDRVSTGIYVLSPDTVDLIPEGQKYDFAADLFPRLLADGVPMTGRLMDGYWCDIGTPRSYFQCNLDALDGLYRLPGRDGTAHRVIPCRDRAGLMRLLSETLTEFGADMTDGLTYTSNAGRAHLAPMTDREAIALDGDPAAVRDMEALTKQLNRQF